MKDIIICICTAALLICATSCRKETPSTSFPSNTWKFLDSTYHTVSCIADSNVLIASNEVSGNGPYSYSSVTVGFANSLPASSGTYKVANCISGNFHLRPDEAYVFLKIPNAYGLPFISTGVGNVSVSVSGGKVSIAGSDITLAFFDLPSDSAKISFNITQQ